MTPIIDTHTHLSDDTFDGDRAEVLLKAREAGVTTVIVVSENPDETDKVMALSDQYAMLKPALGQHPTDPDNGKAEVIYKLIRRHYDQLAAIGEVGLDYWIVKDESQRRVQQEIFRGFIDLSLNFDLPLNVHSRSAGRDAVTMLLDGGALRVQLHAFDGRASKALPGVEAGYFFSVPPSVVRSRQKQKLVSRLPLSSLLVETDSPELGPEAGVRNEPANIGLVIDAIAEIKGVHQDEVREAVFENTCRLYGARVCAEVL